VVGGEKRPTKVGALTQGDLTVVKKIRKTVAGLRIVGGVEAAVRARKIAICGQNVVVRGRVVVGGGNVKSRNDCGAVAWSCLPHMSECFCRTAENNSCLSIVKTERNYHPK
jgi:hypothetical protein